MTSPGILPNGVEPRESWLAAHPFLVFGLTSLVFVALSAWLEVGPYSPAGWIARIIIWPMYAGWTAAMLIGRALFGFGPVTDAVVYAVRFLAIPLTIAPYLLCDWLLLKARRRRSDARVASSVARSS